MSTREDLIAQRETIRAALIAAREGIDRALEMLAPAQASTDPDVCDHPNAATTETFDGTTYTICPDCGYSS